MLSALYDGLEVQVVADCTLTLNNIQLQEFLLFIRTYEIRNLLCFINKPNALYESY